MLTRVDGDRRREFYLRECAESVPAVYDVFAAQIKALRSKNQGRQNVPEQRRGNGAKRNDLATRVTEPPTGGEAHIDLLKLSKNLPLRIFAG
jgi:hypothetical protein